MAVLWRNYNYHRSDYKNKKWALSLYQPLFLSSSNWEIFMAILIGSGSLMHWKRFPNLLHRFLFRNRKEVHTGTPFDYSGHNDRCEVLTWKLSNECSQAKSLSWCVSIFSEHRITFQIITNWGLRPSYSLRWPRVLQWKVYTEESPVRIFTWNECFNLKLLKRSSKRSFWHYQI